MTQNEPTQSKKKTFLSYIQAKIDLLKKLIGIVDEKTPISFKLSEFMQEVNSSLENLPDEYKKNYELKPVEDKFFVNKESEINALESSFSNWMKNRFVTCAIVGQKGSGVTSTLDFFLAQHPQVETIRVELKEKVYTKSKYFSFFNKLLNTEGINTNKELIEYLNKIENEKIIVIENLQHMFLKKVGGFESMELLYELLSYTTKKVLWIGVFTPQTWNYLDKTISISNYFTSEIVMQELDSQMIKDIMLKRLENKSTEIEFIPNEETSKAKTFQNLDKEKQQLDLEENYFKILHKLSNGNISLAQLYWIRSISIKDKNILTVKEIDDFDYSFIKNLSSEVLFTLQALILHDGLTIKDFSAVMRESATESRKILMPMLERGLLIQPHEKFNINPAIYKQVFDYLSSKNFIH